MSMDFQDADRQREMDLIPQGTIVRVIGIIRPGGKSRPGQEAADAGFLTASNSSDSMYLSWEFTVTAGPYARRKFWQNMTVHGGEVNERGESKAWNITKSTIRAMLNSARNANPDDDSETAKAKRKINSWADLSGIEFACKMRVVQPKPGTTYQPQNQIGQVIEPDHKDYQAAMSGASVAGAAPAVAAPTPSWAGSAPAAAAAQKPAGAAGNVPAWAR